MISKEKREEIRERWAKAHAAPWGWFGYAQGAGKHIYLATVDRGRQYVMQFTRWGFSGAAPRFQTEGSDLGMRPIEEHLETKNYGEKEILSVTAPDAIAIAEAPSDVKLLLDALDLAESRLSKARETLGKYADEAEWKTCDIDIGCNVKHCFGKSGQHGYDPAQKCLEEIGGKDA